MKVQKVSLIVGLVVLCLAPSVVYAQSVPTDAEGPFARSANGGQYGVNRRVAIATTGHPDVTGYASIQADFDCVLNAFQNPTITDPGHLLNKPSYYFGINGPGWEWIETTVASPGHPAVAGHWAQWDNVEVDAGLEYDTRNAYRGWRAFISANGHQVNQTTSNGTPWRGQAQQYFLRLDVDNNGVPHLVVNGTDANFTLDFTYTDRGNSLPAGQSGLHTVYDGTLKYLIGLKRVIADTRPNPALTGQSVAYNWHLDGTRINCITSNCYIWYWWNGHTTTFGKEYVTASSMYAPINGPRTNYDTPQFEFDTPMPNGRPSIHSRFIVDFPDLTGATARPNTELIDLGRNRGVASASLKQDGVSHYTNETVRINLGQRGRGVGRLWIRAGSTRNP